MLKSFFKKFASIKKLNKKYFKYLKPQKNKLQLAFLAGLGYTLMGILEPWPLKIIFDSVFYNDPFFLKFEKNTLLIILVAAIVIIALMRGLFYYYQQLLMARTGQQVISKIRVDLFSHLQFLPLSFHNRRKTGELISRLTSDIRLLREMLISLPLSLSTDLMLMSFMLLVMGFMNLTLTFLATLTLPLLLILLRKYSSPMKAAMKQQREREGTLSSIAGEVFGAIRVVQGFHSQEREVKKFSTQNKDTLKLGLKASRLEAKLKWASELSVALITALILLIAGRSVLKGSLTPGDLLVFTYYLKMFNRPLRRLSKYLEQSARSQASGERVWEILQLKSNIKEKKQAIDAPPFKGEIHFENVTFIYQSKREILKKIDLTIAPGEKVLISGHTGSGKSTLLSLIPRFWDPTQGRVLIDGIDLKEVSLLSLREQIAIVFQEPFLFADTVYENIAYGKPDASREEVIEAAKKTGIHDMILSLEDGYDTHLGERGAFLSGGQRQLISIARALIKDAPILLMDEPTTGLDQEAAEAIIATLEHLMKDKTALYISHHETLFPRVDRHIKLSKGKICRTVCI